MLGQTGVVFQSRRYLVEVACKTDWRVEFSFLKFTALAFPMMLGSIALCQFYILWRYF